MNSKASGRITGVPMQRLVRLVAVLSVSAALASCEKYSAAMLGELPAPRAELPAAPPGFGQPSVKPMPTKRQDPEVYATRLAKACAADEDTLALDRSFYEMVRQKFSAAPAAR